MPRITKIFAICVLFAGSCFAATTNASIKGTYAFHMSSAKYEGWGQSISCQQPDSSFQTISFGGNTVVTQSVLGTITFDGKGNITAGTFTQYGQFDQGLSNATVVPSCTPGQGSNGYAVYDAPVTGGTLSGTYSIGANATGTLSPITSTGDNTADTFYVVLSGTAAVKTTIFMVDLDGADSNQPNREEISGTAVLQ
jgi:hypothetical protein